MVLDKKKMAAVMAAVDLYLEQEKTISFYIPEPPKFERKESPWVKSGRYSAMMTRIQCQQRLFK